MAQRFGGKFSPQGDSSSTDTQDSSDGKWREAKVDPVGARSNVLFVPPIVLVFTSLGAGAVDLAVTLIAAAVMLLGAWLLRDGMRAEAAFDARKHARKPAPRKIMAALACAVGAGLAVLSNEGGFLAPLMYGAIVLGLHLAAFGLDPMKDKLAEPGAGFQLDRVARVVDEAEDHLAAMLASVRRAGDRGVEDRVERFQITVRDMIRTVEEDPRDLTPARKYLGVYLMGARDAAEKYATIVTRAPNASARSDFMMLLTDLEESFGKKTKALMADNNIDLSIEIETLRERLQRESSHLDR